METWKECGWAACSKRFEPGRRNNQHLTLVVGTTVALFIAPALVSRKPIDGVCKRHGKRCQALPPTQPSHALFRILKTLRDFRRKMSIVGRHFSCPRATSRRETAAGARSP